MSWKFYAPLATALALCGCGGDSLCGNGIMDPGEQCDTGKNNGKMGSGCTAQCTFITTAKASVQVSYTLLRNEVMGFPGASCGDMQIDHAVLTLEGPDGNKDDTEGCSTNSHMWTDVMPGSYKASVTLFGASGAISNALESMPVDVAAPNTATLAVNFTQMDMTKQDYTGTLNFLPHWGSVAGTCTSVGINKQTVKLVKLDSTPVSGMTVDGLKLDGTAGTCYEPPTTDDKQKVQNLPWGHYKLQITGLQGTNLMYCKTTEVFVGPGVANPTVDITVDSVTDASQCPAP